ncbi:MAG: nuclear transport factor 2 family protein [Chloroflexota bacterium]
MSIEQNKALVVRFLDWWARGDLSALDETLADDVVSHQPAGEFRGREVLKSRLAGHRDFFTDRKLVLHEMIAEGDRVAVRFTWSGLAKDHQVELTNVSIYRIADGRIAEEWEEYNTASLAQQSQAS